MHILFFIKENDRIWPVEKTIILVLNRPIQTICSTYSKWYSSCQRLVSLNCWPVYTGLSSKDASLKTTRRTSKMTIPRLDKGFFIEIYSIFFNSFWNDFEKKNVFICMKSWMWEYRLHEFSEVAEVSSVEDSPVYSKNSGKNQIF